MSLSEVWGPAAGKVLVVGLTGGIASGKSEVTSELRRLGARVIDADRVAREVTLPGTSVYQSLREEFGESILGEEGEINRGALAGAVFADESKRRVLNSIAHPAIFTGIVEGVKNFAGNLGPDDVPAVVIDAALIVDVGVSEVFDLLIVVTADEGARLERLTRYRGMDESEARDRISSQIPDRKRLGMADFVIENNGSIEQLKSRVAEVWGEIEKRSRSGHS